MLHYEFIDFLAFVFPVCTHNIGNILVRNGQGEVDYTGAVFFNAAMDRIITGGCSVIFLNYIGSLL